MAGARRRAAVRPGPAPAGADRHQGATSSCASTTARSSSRCWCRAAATGSCGTTRRSALRPDRSRRASGRRSRGGDRQRSTGRGAQGARRRATTSSHFRRAIQVDAREARRVIDHWRQGWLPGEDVAKIAAARRARACRLGSAGRPTSGSTSRASREPPPAAARRRRSGRGRRRRRLLVHLRAGARSRDRRLPPDHRRAPMMPNWAFGLWQCRERYKTSQESSRCSTVSGRGIPVDVSSRTGSTGARPMGLARVRPGALSRSRRAGSNRSTTGTPAS